MVLLKNFLHNIFVLVVGFLFAALGKGMDQLFGWQSFNTSFSVSLALLLLTIGFLLRVWATSYFYQNGMKVVSLHTQNKLITKGPFSFSRNPLYLGGNVFIFFGADLFLKSPAAIFITLLNILLLNFWMIPREEKQLKKTFGKSWGEYKKRVRRWL